MTAFLVPDPVLPQMAIATDANAMRDLVATHFVALRDIPSCQLARIRYRRGERAIVQYSVGTRWVTALVYPHAEIPRLWRKVQRQLETMPMLATQVVRLDDQDLVLQHYPFDWNLPTLSRVIESLPQRLSNVTSAAAQIQQTQIEPVRYRAGLSAVLRCTLDASPQPEYQTKRTCVFAKVFPIDQGQHYFSALNQLCSQKTFCTPRPIAFFSDLSTVILEAAHGDTLEQYILRGDALDAIQSVAQTLAQVHLDPDFHIDRQVTLDDEIADIHRTGLYLMEACSDEHKAISSLVQRIVTSMQPCALAPAHRDLKPDHLFLDAAGVTFIDIDSCAMADPVMDVALLMARLIAIPYSLDLSHADANTMADELCNTYFAQVPATWRTRLPLALAGSLLAVAASFCRRAAPNWPVIAHALLQTAKATLEA